jgi:hypothetical protein
MTGFPDPAPSAFAEAAETPRQAYIPGPLV